MKKFIKENWFKLSVILILIIICFSLFYYFIIFIPQKEQTKQDQEATKELKITEEKELLNKCIINAQEERQRREALLNKGWLACLSNLSTPDVCKTFKDNSGIDKLYKGWVDNCERGIQNNF